MCIHILRNAQKLFLFTLHSCHGNMWVMTQMAFWRKYDTLVKCYTTCTCWKILKQEWLGFSLCWRHLMWEGDWFNTHLWLFIFSEILCKGNMLFLWKKELESRFTEFCTLHWRSLWITVCKTLSKTVQQLFSCYFILLINIFVTW